MPEFNKEAWLEKCRQAKSSEEMRALLNEVPPLPLEPGDLPPSITARKAASNPDSI